MAHHLAVTGAGERRRPGPTDAALGLVLAVLLAATALLLADSWGGASWVLDASAGGVVTVLAVVRHRHRAGTALAGLLVAGAAMAASALADLPAEPGPATSLALAVLLGSSLRWLRPLPAAGLAAGGGLVVAGAWLAGSAPIGVWATAAWLAALAVGLTFRAAPGGGH